MERNLDAFEKWFASQSRVWQAGHFSHSLSMREAWNEAFEAGRKDCEIEMEAAGFRQG